MVQASQAVTAEVVEACLEAGTTGNTGTDCAADEGWSIGGMENACIYTDGVMNGCVYVAPVAAVTTVITSDSDTCCSENVCTAGAAPTGYTTATPAGTTISGLGAVACAAGYSGTAAAGCVEGAAFTFTGCTISATCDTFTCPAGWAAKATPAALSCNGAACDSAHNVCGDHGALTAFGDDQDRAGLRWTSTDGTVYTIHPDDYHRHECGGGRLPILTLAECTTAATGFISTCDPTSPSAQNAAVTAASDSGTKGCHTRFGQKAQGTDQHDWWHTWRFNSNLLGTSDGAVVVSDECSAGYNPFVGAKANNHPICIVPQPTASTTQMDGSTTDVATCCDANACTDGSADVMAAAGYVVPTPAGLSVAALGALTCNAAVNFVGGPPHPQVAAVASCPTDGGAFAALSGCVARAACGAAPTCPTDYTAKAGSTAALCAGGTCATDSATAADTDTCCTAPVPVAEAVCATTYGIDQVCADASACTVACEAGTVRTQAEVTAAVGSGATCTAIADCANGDGACVSGQCTGNSVATTDVACAAGSTATAGATGTDQAACCTATLCAINENVVNNACTACGDGKTATAGADASGADTTCGTTATPAPPPTSGAATVSAFLSLIVALMMALC